MNGYLCLRGGQPIERKCCAWHWTSKFQAHSKLS
jgi:hypothetical protein